MKIALVILFIIVVIEYTIVTTVDLILNRIQCTIYKLAVLVAFSPLLLIAFILWCMNGILFELIIMLLPKGNKVRIYD